MDCEPTEANNVTEGDFLYGISPKLNQEFDSEEDAFNFYNAYGGLIGFSIRRSFANKNKNTKEVTSRGFVCSKQGVRISDKRDKKTETSRAETRTGCDAKMSIVLDRNTSKYKVYEFNDAHNHPLHLSQCTHMMRSQWKISEVQLFQLDLADDSGIRLKGSHELASRLAGGIDCLGFTRLDHKNYLRTKRQQNLQYGEAGGILRYFQKQIIENPSFYYAIQLDCEEQITNIFWADARMLMDYSFFGDVVVFDTTFNTNRDLRPFGVFAGFNHHRSMVIFGASLLYDETIDSFKWLFATFLEAHNSKKPQTIFTDQDSAMAAALKVEMKDTKHALCTFHIMRNAIKHLVGTLDNESSLLKHFSKCVYEYESECQFNEAWDIMIAKNHVEDNTWLKEIYKLRDKWAKPYMKNYFSLGIRSTQLSESLNASLKKYLRPDYDVVKFFHHFERAVNDKRYNELEAEYHRREKMPRMKFPNAVLVRAGEIYTPHIFEEFQEEFIQSISALISTRLEVGMFREYMVTIHGQPKSFNVICMPHDKIVSCDCRRFETFGILCCHALGVLRLIGVMDIPDQYILKRWTVDARNGIVEDIKGQQVYEDLRSTSTTRYRILSHNLTRLATIASDSVEATEYVLKFALEAMQHVNQMQRTIKHCSSYPTGSVPSTNTIGCNSNASIDVDMTKGLKKNDKPKCGKRRRHKSFVETMGSKKSKVSSVKSKQKVRDVKNKKVSLEVGLQDPKGNLENNLEM